MYAVYINKKNVNASFLWNKKWGPSFFSNVMSRNCFMEMLRFFRFDNKNERSQRLGKDKFALVSRVWNAFIKNSQNCYKPAANITVDEQLFPTKLDVDSPNTCRISPINLASNFGWRPMSKASML